eukprot:2083950-Rhodomonas_salina.1
MAPNWQGPFQRCGPKANCLASFIQAGAPSERLNCVQTVGRTSNRFNCLRTATVTGPVGRECSKRRLSFGPPGVPVSSEQCPLGECDRRAHVSQDATLSLDRKPRRGDDRHRPELPHTDVRVSPPPQLCVPTRTTQLSLPLLPFRYPGTAKACSHGE